MAHGHFEKLQEMRKRAKGVVYTNKIGLMCKAEHVGECLCSLLQTTRSNLQFYRGKERELRYKHQCVANLDATAQRGPRTNMSRDCLHQKQQDLGSVCEIKVSGSV